MLVGAFWLLVVCERLLRLLRVIRSRLAAVDTKAHDEAACAGSPAVWTLGVAGMADGSWEGKARSLQLPIVRIHPTLPQPPATDLCLVQ